MARALFHPVARVIRLLRKDAEVWEGDNLIISRGHGYDLHAFRYVGPQGEIRWQTASISEHSPMHTYWIASDAFYLTKGKLWKKKYKGDFMGPIASSVDPEERAALLEAIQQTEKAAQQPAIQLG